MHANAVGNLLCELCFSRTRKPGLPRKYLSCEKPKRYGTIGTFQASIKTSPRIVRVREGPPDISGTGSRYWTRRSFSNLFSPFRISAWVCARWTGYATGKVWNEAFHLHRLAWKSHCGEKVRLRLQLPQRSKGHHLQMA